MPIEKFCQTAGKSKLNRRRKILRLRIHQKGKKASNPQGKEKKKGFSSWTIPKGIRLSLAPKIISNSRIWDENKNKRFITLEMDRKEQEKAAKRRNVTYRGIKFIKQKDGE